MTVLRLWPLLASALLLRVGLILYSEWHDARSVVKYTDVDYRVFSDATRFLLNPGQNGTNTAQGPLARLLDLKVGDPYTRETYRYTPLLAVILSPNEWLHPSFGKYLFAACDLLNGLLIRRILFHFFNLPEKQANLFAATHLLNPLVFSISTRGSSESILCSLVLLILYYVLQNQWNKAALMLGISIHWKIYPVIYAVSCLECLRQASVRTFDKSRSQGGVINHALSYINAKAIKFALISGGTFVILGIVNYLIWGWPFLSEAYLYHLHRLDHRHNFSPYFYLTYLTYPSGAESTASISTFERVVRSPLVSFLPQLVLTAVTGMLFGKRKQDPPFAWFVQTTVFVLFNKVCTSQYFLWYLLFVPLIAPRLSISIRSGIVLLVIWVGGQAVWLAEAYKLEFLGENVFFSLWIRSLICMASHCYGLARIIQAYH